MAVFTVGHSNRSLDDLIALLQMADIDILVDVRTWPRSQYNPQFNEEMLQKALPDAGIDYKWRGKNLGGKTGREGNVDYEKTIDWVVSTGERVNVALMCSEGAIDKCHRNYMLTPDVLKRGVEVTHILWSGELKTVSPSVVNVGLFEMLPPAPEKLGLQPMWSH
jgi:uncharacterized protein (DUF488 family)